MGRKAVGLGGLDEVDGLVPVTLASTHGSAVITGRSLLGLKCSLVAVGR